MLFYSLKTPLTEEEAALDAIVDKTTTFGLLGADHLPAELGDEVVLLDVLVGKTAPTGHFRGRHNQLFAEPALNGHILANGFAVGFQLA